MKKLVTKVSRGKLERSALIALIGWSLIAIPYLCLEFADLIATGNGIDWKTPVIMGITAFSTWFTNTVRVMADQLQSSK